LDAEVGDEIEFVLPNLLLLNLVPPGSLGALRRAFFAGVSRNAAEEDGAAAAGFPNPTGRYEDFVDCRLPCLNDKLGGKFRAIPAHGIPINNFRAKLQIPRFARDDNL